MNDSAASVGTPAVAAWLRRRPVLRRLAGRLLQAIAYVRRPRKLFATIWYRMRLGYCGARVDFESHMLIRNPGKISIGSGCSFSQYVVLDAHDSITIGTNCMFALRVTIATATHDHARHPMNERTITKPVVIDDDVWLGIGATVLPGVRIGRGAVVGAHALVTKDVPPFAIVVGVPARIVKYRQAREERA